MTQRDPDGPEQGLAPNLIRGVMGGALMGLANLVPGISGGTMLLAAGVYPQFIEGVAEMTTLRFKPRTVALLAAIGGAAAVAIVAFAGLVKGLVVDHRWMMFSLFIGLTLGGVPVVWRLLRPLKATAVAGCLVGVLLMTMMATARPGASADAGAAEQAYLLLFIAGMAGASAMILPGVSGGYLLLILGVYLAILGAIDDAKLALLGSGGPDWAALGATLHVFVPLGLGVLVGAVGISNLMRLALARFEKGTLGVLLGLLLGAVLGLWPFQKPVPPQAGDVIKGQVVTAASLGEIEPEDFPLERFTPTGTQVAGAAGIAFAGFWATQGVAFVGRIRWRSMVAGLVRRWQVAVERVGPPGRQGGPR